jgi:transposase-like protein
VTAVIQEAYIQGISTRSVDELVKAMGRAAWSIRSFDGRTVCGAVRRGVGKRRP